MCPFKDPFTRTLGAREKVDPPSDLTPPLVITAISFELEIFGEINAMKMPRFGVQMDVWLTNWTVL